MKLLTNNLIDFDLFEKLGYIEYFNHCKSNQSAYDRMIVDFSHLLELKPAEWQYTDEMALAMSFRRRYREAISILTSKSKLFLELEKLNKEMAEYEKLKNEKFYTVKVAQSYLGETIK